MTIDPVDSSRLLIQVQRQLRDLLKPRVETLLDEFEARLFELADRCRVTSQQHAYLDALRECRRRRSDTTHDFLQGVAAALRPRQDSSLATLQPIGLRLLEHDELEETMALSALADRIAQRADAEARAFGHRLDFLLGETSDADVGARLDPAALARIFRAACQHLEIGVEVRLVAYTLFGHHVLDALPAIYRRLNERLREAGVLPDLRGERRQLHISHHDRRRRRASDMARDLPTLRDAEPDPQALIDLLGGLLDEAAATYRAPTVQTSPALSPRLIDNALDSLRDFAGEPRSLKRELLSSSRGLSEDPGATLAVGTERTIDLVALVFDFVRHDPDLPEAMQPLLARLQVPFLRSALADPQVLGSETHPARRLLDELGEVAIGWCPAVDPDAEILERVRATVDLLVQRTESGRPAFDRALQILGSHMETDRRRAEAAEQRTVEGALGRERLRIARSRVATMIERRVGTDSALAWIRQLVRGPWANYLVLVWLRQGERGDAWRDGLAFIDELLWCDAEGSSPQNAAQLVDTTELLEDALREGLEAVAYQNREIEGLVGELRLFAASLRRRHAPPPFMHESHPKLAAMDFGLSWTDLAKDEQPEPIAADADLVQKLRTLPAGTWFEFGQGAERAKLCWTSPFSDRCLFVNRIGMRTRESSPTSLARQMAEGEARILRGRKLLQRAVETVLDRVRGEGVEALRDWVA